jgi:DnaD/phage-associated family protein
MIFDGLPGGKIKFDRIPRCFFSDLLPQINHLGELKVTLYALWRLDQMEGDIRYLTLQNFLEDTLFISGLADSFESGSAILGETLGRCVKRGTLLMATVCKQGGDIALYFFNSPKGRAMVEAIQQGEWRPLDDGGEVPIELVPERPNIYTLYEEHIGPITPLLAEALVEAEDEYPANWIEEAFRIAVEKNVRNWRYIEAILRRWHERGYDAREDRRDTEKIRQQYADWED